VRWLAVAFRWSEPRAASNNIFPSSSIKLTCCSDLQVPVDLLLMCGHHGGGTIDGEEIWIFSRSEWPKIVLHEFLGVHQPGTCDSRSCLAPASSGRRAALLSHFLLAVLQPPGVMPTRRPISCFVMALIGALAPSGSSPVTRMLATM
jgi:hypothetical protein